MVDPHALLPDLNAARVSEANRRSRFLLIARSTETRGGTFYLDGMECIATPAPRGTTTRPGDTISVGGLEPPIIQALITIASVPSIVSRIALATRRCQGAGAGAACIPCCPGLLAQTRRMGSETRGDNWRLEGWRTDYVLAPFCFYVLEFRSFPPSSALGVAHRQYAKSCQRATSPFIPFVRGASS